MALIINPSLPAAQRLADEGHAIEAPGSIVPDATIALINLMPNKPDTEYDFLQLIAPCQANIAILLIDMASHQSRHTDPSHLKTYYNTFQEVANQIDGLIITGAPLDHVAFEDVDYWEEITGIFRYIRDKSIPTMNVCWAAFASLYFWHHIAMHAIDDKISGVFPHHIFATDSPLMKGIEEGFMIPHSRYVIWNADEIASCHNDLQIIAAGQKQGIYIVASRNHPECYVAGHGEYAPDTLDKEYRRDLKKGINPHIPENYYQANNPSRPPIDTWHDTGVKIMANWINQVILYKQSK